MFRHGNKSISFTPFNNIALVELTLISSRLSLPSLTCSKMHSPENKVRAEVSTLTTEPLVEVRSNNTGFSSLSLSCPPPPIQNIHPHVLRHVTWMGGIYSHLHLFSPSSDLLLSIVSPSPPFICSFSSLLSFRSNPSPCEEGVGL